MDTKLRAYLAEFLGTFVLVYLGAGVVCAFHLPSNPLRVEVTGIALAVGFTLAVLLSTTYLVSGGCLNPAIALMLYVYKRYDRTQLIYLIAAHHGKVRLSIRSLPDEKRPYTDGVITGFGAFASSGPCGSTVATWLPSRCSGSSWRTATISYEVASNVRYAPFLQPIPTS